MKDYFFDQGQISFFFGFACGYLSQVFGCTVPYVVGAFSDFFWGHEKEDFFNFFFEGGILVIVEVCPWILALEKMN